MTTPVAKLCQSTTSTDGPTVLKNSPPGFYSSVVWKGRVGGGHCQSTGSMWYRYGNSILSGLARRRDSTYSKKGKLTRHALFHDRTGYTANAFPIMILRHQYTLIFTALNAEKEKLAVNSFSCQMS